MVQQCWEIKQCGREEGGIKVGEMGVCPAATDIALNGLNKGINAGRMCWCTAGTFCGGKAQGTFSEKQATCMACEVFQQVRKEEGTEFKIMK